ncbi:alkylation response protein AidB-like acyl-CoA dehydrogenase [Actinoalloteichus hoggarensis]|uniref:Acyl-CoA dehydrogenase n=1 Tax=Actinoalloteichus hoggarensis TaxID=1470176 RepID=A0A221VX78_9PSEU|nr:acyl-CoA dehydrogenase family protein [Actinoalloteichus hoggarensis]ASO18113.1 Acyl-CoA dehydrogenase [Actinoalloteichus hoggarensis]MBB5921470.1 alkylation response protein AidB-like acyl-CoA dehydrogenase [Actinoalloteichus hoggarensis]
MSAPVVDHRSPDPEAAELIALVREIGRRELEPQVNEAEAEHRFPRETFRNLGRAGLLGLPYSEEHGGGGLRQELYLQVVEELSRYWLAVGLGVSVHTLACHGLATFGTSEQQARWLPEMLGGEQLGAYCLSEPHAGSDAAALRTRAEAQPDGGHRLTGTKAWITHGGVADFYLVLARTGADGPKGISAFLVRSDDEGISAAPPERKMGARSSITAQVSFDGVRLPADRMIGGPGEGFGVAMSALACGRLGIAAGAVGVAQAALDVAVAYARERTAFGRSIADFQGVSFLLADAAAGIEAARQLYLYAARRKDDGLPFATEAAMAKLIATDTCMRVTTDMVQVLGGAGYVEDHPVERYMREAKMLQIVEGTNQIQRLVIGRELIQG